MGIISLQSAKCAKFWPAHGVHARNAILEPVDVHQTLRKVYLIPSQGNYLANPVTMAESQ